MRKKKLRLSWTKFVDEIYFNRYGSIEITRFSPQRNFSHEKYTDKQVYGTLKLTPTPGKSHSESLIMAKNVLEKYLFFLVIVCSKKFLRNLFTSGKRGTRILWYSIKFITLRAKILTNDSGNLNKIGYILVSENYCYNFNIHKRLALISLNGRPHYWINRGRALQFLFRGFLICQWKIFLKIRRTEDRLFLLVLKINFQQLNIVTLQYSGSQ